MIKSLISKINIKINKSNIRFYNLKQFKKIVILYTFLNHGTKNPQLLNRTKIDTKIVFFYLKIVMNNFTQKENIPFFLNKVKSYSTFI